uniref:Uncharacterized protein n=1 Tax=Amphimedon queenslandica TaxID=400682 RepID=A0A1X7UTA9_AMPQE
MEVFDAGLAWWFLGYNRRRLRALGKNVPPDTMPPRASEYYVSHGISTEYPDWPFSAARTESLVKIGFDYARDITGEGLFVDLDSFQQQTSDIAPNLDDEIVTMANESVPLVILHSHSLSASPPRHQRNTPPQCCTPPQKKVAIWEQIFETTTQSGKIGAVVHNLLEKYKEKCTEEL